MKRNFARLCGYAREIAELDNTQPGDKLPQRVQKWNFYLESFLFYIY